MSQSLCDGLGTSVTQATAFVLIFQTFIYSWRGHIFIAVCLCECVCLCVSMSVNKIQAERINDLDAVFALVSSYPIIIDDLGSKVKVTMM